MESSSPRVPPHNNEAETSVLGSILTTPDVFDKVASLISPEMFYYERHGKIFATMQTLNHNSKPADLLLVAEELERTNQLSDIGGHVYLVGLQHGIPTTAYVDHYAKIIREKYILRRLIQASNKATQLAYDQQLPLEDLLDQAEKLVFDVAEDKLQNTTDKDMKQLSSETLLYIQDIMNNKIVDGIKTGFIDLDKKINGLQNGGLIIIAARPAMGKTAFALSIAQNIAIREKKTVAVFSLEMPSVQLVMRMMCSEANISMSRIRESSMHPEDFNNLIEVSSKISDAPLIIDDDPNLNINTLRAKLRRIVSKHGDLKLVIIDYLQLMSGVRQNSENRQQEISAISRGLKNLARELDIPIIVLSQLSRAVEQRPNKRPMLSDLRESGAIEQDADVVLFIYRDEYYNKENDTQGLAEVIIGKQRNGPTGNVDLQFHAQHVKFNNHYTGIEEGS